MRLAARSPSLAGSDPLVFRRLRSAEAASLASLGGRWVGDHADALDAPLLQPAGAVFDAWLGGAALRHGAHGCVRFTTDGTWLHGCAEIDDAAFGLHDATRRAYADVFDVIAAERCPHLLRLWNYLADINRHDLDPVPDVEATNDDEREDRAASERYRRFNAGRQQAFIDARRSAFEGAPAACALGTQGGPLRVYFLAGRAAPIAIENPRQVSAYRYPDRYGPRSPTFSRAALAEVGDRRALFISGTASIVGHASVHVGDVRRQTEESLANIGAVRDAAAARAGVEFAAAELIYTVYLRHAGDLAAVREVFERAVGAQSRAARDAVYLHADICRADLLVEIEAHGFGRNGSPV